MSASATSNPHCTGSSSQSSFTRKGYKGTQTGKEKKKKLSLFADDINLHIEYPKESTKTKTNRAHKQSRHVAEL